MMPMSGRCVVDTNILFYYVSAEDLPRHEQAKKFMEQVKENPGKFVITFQSLRELSAALIKRTKLKSHQINEFVWSFRHLFGDVLYDNPLDLQVAADLARINSARFYDMLIISTSARYEIDTFYTENVKDFQKMPGITVINPLIG